MDTNNNPGPGESDVPTSPGGSNAPDDVTGFSEESNASLGESDVPTSPGESSASLGESNIPT